MGQYSFLFASCLLFFLVLDLASGRRIFTTGEIAGQGYQETYPPGPTPMPFFKAAYGGADVQFAVSDVGWVYVWSNEDPDTSPGSKPIYGLGSGALLNKTSNITRLSGVANALLSQTIETMTGCLDECFYQSLFLKTHSGLVFSHGIGNQGSLGNQVASVSNVWLPTRIIFPAPFDTREAVQVAAGDGTTVVLFNDGSVAGFGSNSQYQLCETTPNIVVPKAHVLSDLRAVWAGPFHNAYVASNGSIYFCGAQSSGSFANSGATAARYSVPIRGLFSAGTSFVYMRLFPGFGVGLTSSRAVLTWGSNATGEAGVRGTGIGPRSVTFGSNLLPISLHASWDNAVTVYAVLVSSATGARSVQAWGWNPDMILRPGSGRVVVTPTALALPPNSQLLTRRFEFISGSIRHMHIFTTDGFVAHYPALYGNVVDTHRVVPEDDTIVDVYAAVNGEMWVGISTQNNLYLATSDASDLNPLGYGIAPSPTRVPLPPGVKVKIMLIDQVYIGLSGYEIIAVVGNDSRIWTLGYPSQTQWTPLPFLVGRNITHLETTSLAFIAATDARDLYFYEMSGYLGLSGSNHTVSMVAVPANIRWTKITFSCIQTYDGNDAWLCSHGPTAFLLANDGSVWVVGVAAPYWSFNPIGGQNWNVTRFLPATYTSRVFVDIGHGPYGLFLIDSEGLIWGATDSTDINQVPLASGFPADKIVSVAVSACGATFIGESGKPWVTGFSTAICERRLTSSDFPNPPAEYDSPIPDPVEEMSFRRVRKAVATGTASGHGAIFLADFEIDWTHPLTRVEVPVGATFLQLFILGAPTSTFFSDFRGTFVFPDVVPEITCTIKASRPNAVVQYDVVYKPWLVTCDLSRSLAVTPGTNAQFKAKASTEETIDDPRYRISIVPAPSVSDRTDLKTPNNAPTITIYGTNLGYFDYKNGSDVISVRFGDSQTLFGECSVRFADGSRLTCSPQTALPFGSLFVLVTRFGSPSSVGPAITITDAPNIVSPSSRLIPYNARLIRFSVQFINTDLSDLSIRYFWKDDPRRSTQLNCIPLLAEQNAVDTSIVTITCERINSTRDREFGVWEVLKQGGVSRTFEIGIPTNATTVITPKSVSRIAASTKTFFIPGIGFGEDVKAVAVQLSITTAKRATFTYACTPNVALNEQIVCDVNESQLPLPVGSLSASVTAYGINSSWVPIAVIVDAPIISTPNPTPIRASNAQNVLIYGSNFDPVPGANVVTLSSGSVNCTRFVNSALYCLFITPPALGDLRATVIAFGGTSGAPAIIATVQSPPVVTRTAGVTLNPGATVITVQGSNFDPNFTNVTLNLRGSFDFNCISRPSQTTTTQVVCDIDNGGSLNTTGSLTAIVFAYGGSSGAPEIIASVDSAPLADQSGIGLGTGAISGISVAAAALAILLIVVAILLIVRMRRRAAEMANQLELDDNMRQQLNIQASELQVLNKLGEGSFGAVYLGKYNKQFVAIKRLTASVLSSQIAEFFREASLMLSIKQHPNVVRIYGMCQELRNLSLVMEFLSGGSVDGYVAGLKERGETISESTLWRIVAGIAAGMQSLASQNIVHRDLAARNILLDSQHEPRVSDFGFSRVVGDEGAGKTQATVGPIKWMPPESLRDRTYSEKSDVWAFGVTLLEIVTAEDPYPGKDLLQIATGVRDAGLTPADQIPKDCPEYLRELMEMCWAQDAAARPSFADIVAYLDHHMPSGITKKPRETASEPNPNVSTSSRKKDKEKGKDIKYSEM